MASNTAYLVLKDKCECLDKRNDDLMDSVDRLKWELDQSKRENERLRGHLLNLDRVRAILDPDTIDEAIRTAKEYERQIEQQKEQQRRKSQYRNEYEL